MKIPEELIRALYDVPAYRGSASGRASARGRWWSSSPEEASSKFYVGDINAGSEGGHVIPGQLNTDGFGQVDAQGKQWDHLTEKDVKTSALAAMLLGEYSPGRDQRARTGHFTADLIAEAADLLGLPGVTFRNVRDESGVSAHQYYVSDPSRRRSRFAAFKDTNSEDLMAGVLLSLMGGGAALSQREEQ